MRPILRIHLLGVPHASRAEQPLSIPRQQARALLYRLALDLQPVARDELCFLFWPDTGDATARRNLTQLLSHLRRALPVPDLLLAAKDHVRLDPARVWSDTARFEALYTGGDRSNEQHRQMVDLYRGPFLDGLSLPHAPEYETWQLAMRRRYEQRTLEALSLLLEDATKRGNQADAIAYAQRYLALDELDEKVHRQLIELYAASGDRAAALQHYGQCEAVLARELGVDPLPETRAVYQAALAGRARIEAREHVQPVWPTLPGPNVPLIGRAGALQALGQQFQRMQAGQGQLVLVTGEAGIGKSRLVQAFAQHVQGEATLLAAACYTNTQAVPYQPLVEALRPTLNRIAPAGSVDAAWLGEASLLFPELRALYPDLPVPAEGRAEAAQGRLFEALRRLLWLVLQDAPVVFCLDDLHWSDCSTLEWLGYLGRYLRGSRLLVVGTVRSEEDEILGELRRQLARLGCLTTMELPPLHRDEIEQFVAHVAGETLSSAALSARLRQVTGGNPFFLQETLQALLESGEIAYLNGATTVPLSATVRETIQRRVQRLSPLARQILEAAAVLGPVFQVETVRQTAGRQELETQDALDELVARRLLRDERHQVRFHHELIQSAVYRDLSHGRRRLLHRRAAATLLKLRDAADAVLPATRAAQIGHHYAETGEQDLAVAYFIEAAVHAGHLHAFHEAIRFYQRALDLLAMLPDADERTQQQIQCQIGLGTAYMVTQGYASPRAQQAYEAALALARRSHSPAIFPALWGIHEVFMFRGEREPAQAAGAACYRLAQETQDPDLLLQAHHALWALHFHSPLSDDGVALALHHAQEGVHLYRAERHHAQTAQYGGHDPGVCGQFMAAKCLWLLGFPDQARTCIEENVALGDTLPHPFSKAHALVSAATVYLYCRQPEMTQKYAQGIISIAGDHFMPTLFAEAKIHLGWSLALQGKLGAGLNQLQAGIETWRAMDIRVQQSYHLALLAETYLMGQQVENGLATLDEAMRMVEVTGERYYAPEIHRLRGALLQAQGKSDEAILAYRRAIATAHTQGLKSLQLRASIGLGRLWQAQGDDHRAHQLLAPIYAEFHEGFDTADLQEARALLAALI